TRWSVRDGAITGKTTADRPLEYNIFLIWRGGTVKDFQLRMKFRIEGEDGFGNSGIQYRSKELKDLGKWVLGGYQADIDLTKKHMGILYEEKMRGIIGPRGQQVMLTAKTTGNQAAAKKNKRPKSDIQVTGTIDGVEDAMAKLEPGKWNTYVITARGRRLVHSINGQMTVKVTDKDSKQWAAEGLLGLQLHRGKPMTVQFKDITLKQFVKAPAAAPKKSNAGMGAQATPVDKIRVAKDFQVELLYSVPRDKQGSWVCITNDPRGRLIVSDQHGQLYRVTPPPLDGSAKQTKVESLTAEIGMAQGLLYAFDSLYVVVNGMRKRQSGLYRLRDTTGDDQFDEVKLLREFKGPGGEHGPHAIRLSPDGKSLYICAGNHTELPDLARSRAPQNWQLDQLLPRLWDATGHATGILAPGGWICKTDPDGKEFELIGNGFRNEYDIAFNAEGELFTYDADMEWDIGSPWYRPTRVNHVTSGSEFGWRSGTGKWPSYYLDSLPAVVDIGPGSPTGITFGTGAKFPEKYQRSLFIADWSYGVIYAVHMTPDGASFRGKAEQFVSAAALQVSDMVVNPGDGAFYFTVGGRETQSGLYRVRYTSQESVAAASKQIDAGTTPRTQRRRLESLHGRQAPNAVREVWPFLGHPDRFIRFAARVALDHQPVDSWRKRAFRETEPQTMLSTLVAMAHQGTTADIDLTLKSLAKLTWEELSRSQRLDMLRCYQLVFIRLGAPGEASGKALQERLEPWYPSSDQAANRELCQLLVYLESPQVLKKTLALLADAKTQEEQIHYALVLRNVKQGWQLDQRRAYFSWFERAAAHNGGHSFDGFLRNIRDDAIALLTAEQRKSLADILNRKPATVETPQVQRPIVKKWTVGDLLTEVANPSVKRDLERGHQIFSEASCFKCHRLQGEGGYVGPDLTAAGRRFNAQNFLEAVLEPSRVISDQYQATMFQMNDGRTIVGRIVNLKGKEYRVRTDQLNPGVLTPVAYENIEVMKPSPVSLMPGGLLDTYQEDEILDLVAYVRSVVNVDEEGEQSVQAPLGFGRQSKRAVSKKRLASKPNVVLIISDDQSWT
ncbi:MAG: family 16 glycoside hydrolase, partial [Pirellulaceae bacterium]